MFVATKQFLKDQTTGPLISHNDTLAIFYVTVRNYISIYLFLYKLLRAFFLFNFNSLSEPPFFFFFFLSQILIRERFYV